MCEKLRDYAVECFTFGVEVVSLYLSSVQNFTRTKEDIEAGCIAEHVMCSSLLPDVTKNFDAKVINAGNMDILPIYLQESAKRLAQDTSQNQKHKLYLCLAYNPIDEIRFAFKKYNDGQDLLKLLWVSERVDLLIRTGKGELASNFLPLQCAGHAKLYTFDELFLNTSVEDIRDILVAHNDSKTKKIQSVDDLFVSQSD
jgi:undecaprenyl diphosphate synthase